MKKYTIIKPHQVMGNEYLENGEVLKAHYTGEDDMQVSDGYHTMDELYEHRITLFIILCKHYLDLSKLAPRVILNTLMGEKAIHVDMRPVWRSKLHSDGSEFEGWFVLGIGKEKGQQITYHLPISKWEETDFAETLEKAPEWDGHTSADVLERLKNL